MTKFLDWLYAVQKPNFQLFQSLIHIRLYPHFKLLSENMSPAGTRSIYLFIDGNEYRLRTMTPLRYW
jgi:hypothetical protein